MPAAEPFAAPPSPSAPRAETAAATAEEAFTASAVLRAERRLRIVEEVTETGMELMRILQREVVATEYATQSAKPADPAGAFARLSRAVRLTLNLEARLEESLRALHAGETQVREARRVEAKRVDDKQEHHRYQDAREDIEFAVVAVIDREAATDAERLDLHDALYERIKFDPAYTGMDERPLREVVEQLCGDLGLSPDWSLWAGDDWCEHDRPLRPRSSPFNRPSPRPLFENSPRIPRVFELADAPEPNRRE